MVFEVLPALGWGILSRCVLQELVETRANELQGDSNGVVKGSANYM